VNLKKSIYLAIGVWIILRMGFGLSLSAQADRIIGIVAGLFLILMPGSGSTAIFMPAAPPRPPDAELDKALQPLLFQDNLIAAIKLCREKTGMGLKDSKDYVEDLKRRTGVIPPSS
jgi:ribosomal protein L7/L12